MAVADPYRVAVNHPQFAAPDDRDAVEKVAACAEWFENGIGKDARQLFEKWYRQYRGFRRFRDDLRNAGSNQNDRDDVTNGAKSEWGAHLHIPLSFRTIETMVPRAVAQRPRMIVMPRHPRWEDNVDAVRMQLDAQQDNIDIDLAFQAIMRSGRIYGLGAGKAYWRKEYAKQRKVRRGVFRPDRYVVGDVKQVCVFDDPDFEDVDIFDLMWDPMGSSMRGSGRAKWVLHRVWLDLDGCVARIRDGRWNTATAQALLAEPDMEGKLRSMGNGQKYSEIWDARMQASGFNSFDQTARGEHIHEVWEWHDGDRVLTVLDRQMLVQDGENPCIGQLPFQVYRPTPLQKQMLGIGDMEPLEHLQHELDTLRSQKRDAATIALMPGFIFDDAMVDEEDLVWGPMSAIRVRNAGDIRNAIQPIPTRDVPGSAVQDEQQIRADFDLIAGVTDSQDQGGSASTATEAQLVQASLSARIELGSRRFEIEVVRNACRTFLALNQRMILQPRQVRQPADGLDTAQAAQEGRWQWFDVGPAEQQGEFEVIPEGGSMAARNVPQDRQDAVQIMQLFGSSPYIDPQKPLQRALKLFGEKNPEAWLKQAEAPVPPAAIEMLKRVVDPGLVDYAVAQAQRSDPMLQQQGPDSSAVANMMQGSG